MSKHTGFTKLLTAMLLSGLLVIGLAFGNVFAADIQEDFGQTSDIVEEVLAEKPTDALVEDVVKYYSITLDANGGYFKNEWDDALGDYVEQAEVIEKHIPVGGTVTSFPIFAEDNPDSQAMLFLGWSTEKDGELISIRHDEYAPEENCVLYAIWQPDKTVTDDVASEDVSWVETENQDSEFVAENTGKIEIGHKTEESEVLGKTEAESKDVEEEDRSDDTETTEGVYNAQESVGVEFQEEAEVFHDDDTNDENDTAFDGNTASKTENKHEASPAQDPIYLDEGDDTVKEDAAMGVESSGTCGDNLTWNLDEEGTLTISGIGDMEDYNYSSHPWDNGMKKVVISDGVTHIGKFAFVNCYSLTSITIPDSVMSIGSGAFEHCSSLNKIILPNSITRIGNCMFEGCESLTDITIPDGITNIGESAFYDCNSLAYISIPESVTSIDGWAFSSCYNLTSIMIPNSVTRIGTEAFSDCINLASITIPDSVTIIEWATFSGCSSLTSVEIPDSITCIEGSAFEGCKKLTSLTIPEGVTCIENYAFYGCTNLSNAFIPSTVETINWANFLYYNDRTGQKEAIPGLTILGYAGSVAQNYANQYNISFRSLSISISGANVTVPNQTFNGEALWPDVTVDFNGTRLIRETDYTVTYKNNINAGIASVIVTGKNRYEGTEETTFTIEKASQPLSSMNFNLRYPYSTELSVSGNKGSLTYESSNSAVATVDTSGIVTAKGAGTATITITAAETDNYKLTTKTITVTVPKISQSIKISDLTLIYPNSGKIMVSGNAGNLSFTSSDTSVATVDAFGNVTTKGAGTTTITITAAETDTCSATTTQITVTVDKADQFIKASNMSLTYPNGGKITASGNKGKLTYKSSNTAVAAVDSSGKVTAEGAGSTKVTITAAATSNFRQATKQITVTVAKGTQSVTAKAAASSIATGKTTTVSLTGAKGTKSFKSSDNTIATVSSTGKVTAKKVGKVSITATSAATANFNKASATVKINVVPLATSSLTAANQATGIKLTWKKVTGATGYLVYRGSTKIATIKSGSTVTYTDAKSNTNGTKYTFKIIPTSSTGKGTAKSLATYRVVRPTINSVANSAAGKMTVKWGKNAKGTGYQIHYCTDKTFKSGNKSVNITSASTASKVIRSLTKGKLYFVRIRTYKTVGRTKYFSAWSPVKSVKISK